MASDLEERIIDARYRLYTAKRNLWQREIRCRRDYGYHPKDDEQVKLEREAKGWETVLDRLETQLGSFEASVDA